jgi:hypothetical protein
METEVNDFLASLTTASIKHVNTAMAAAAEASQMKAETVITIWYDDLSKLKSVDDLSDQELVSIKEENPYSEKTN